MESIAMVRNWSDFGHMAETFKAFRSPKGEEMVLDENFFVEKALPRFVMRKLTEDEMVEINRLYRIIAKCCAQLGAMGVSPELK